MFTAFVLYLSAAVLQETVIGEALDCKRAVGLGTRLLGSDLQ